MGGRLRLAGAPPGVLDAGRDDALHRATARAVGRQAGRLQALHRPSVGVLGDLQGDAGDRHLARTSSSSTATRAAPARRRWSSPITSARRCAKACSSCTTRWSAPACATRIGSARAARSSPASTSRACWRSAPTGATPRAASCSRSAASKPQTCHTDRCPTGVATQNQLRQRALVVRNQGRAGRQVPPQHARRTRRTGGRRRSRPSQ